MALIALTLLSMMRSRPALPLLRDYLLLAVALFLTVLLTLSRWYRDSEMVVWFTSGQSLTACLKPILLFSAPFLVAIILLSLFLSPWAEQRKIEYERQLESRDELSIISPGLFREFRRAGDEGYVELNLSPSERWAAYDFVSYRAGMADRAMPRDPDCTIRGAHDLMIFDAAIPLAGLPPLPWQMGISAVIEEEDGTKSLWALRHGPGPADFHAPACFAARLGAPAAA